MSVTITSPVTGGAQTNLTSPTYTLVADTAPDVNGKQYAVTALGGTQTGVTVHSVASQFTVTGWRPKNFRNLGKPNPTTGLIANVPRNSFKVVTRKGVLPLAGQPFQTMIMTTTIDVPAGADTADPANVRACQSLHNGVLAQISAGLGDTTINGVL